MSRFLSEDVSNHHFGSPELDLSVWLGRRVAVPNQDGRRLRVLDADSGWADVATLTLPGRVESTVALRNGTGWPHASMMVGW